MVRFDREMQMATEEEQWKWCIVFSTFRTTSQPFCVTRPFQHTEDEFQIMVTWMMEEDKNLGSVMILMSLLELLSSSLEVNVADGCP